MIDVFSSSNCNNLDDIKRNALFTKLYRYLDDALKLNVNDMFDAALTATSIEMMPAAKHQFFDKYIKRMSLVIDADGNTSIELRRK